MTPRVQRSRRQSRASFTLIELMVVMAVIAVLASTVLFALYGAVEEAKAARTRTQMARLNELLMTRWESYRTRAVRVSQSTDRKVMARARVDAIRELMRLEMPDRVTDVVNPATYTPSALAAVPALARRYYARSSGTTWATNPSYQGAECLYMIISEMNDVGGNGLDFLQEGEIGDVDDDKMPEILDGWGNPIEFIRWPYGFLSGGLGADGAWNTADDDPSLSAVMVNDPDNAPDPFDPLGVYLDLSSGNKRYPALYPLLYSAGPDGKYDIASDIIDSSGNRLNYSNLTPKNNPYYVPSAGKPLGTPWDADGDGEISYVDNITNHLQGD
jgi:prepilin-type N-terminal cleavage/methylation domain-containing protein